MNILVLIQIGPAVNLWFYATFILFILLYLIFRYIMHRHKHEGDDVRPEGGDDQNASQEMGK
jgi:hypothetical protein